MSLPVYQHINFKTASISELNSILHPELNMKHPVVLNLKNVDIDQQRELIGLIENFFVSANLSYRFPYPVYILSDHEMSITKMPLIHHEKALPKFFHHRKSKMNVKEAHLADKNRLLQQDVNNADALANMTEIENYSDAHRFIFEIEKERKFYRSILNKITKANIHG
jgi:hypothetical protein